MSGFVKNEKGYNKTKFNAKAIKYAYSKAKTEKKHPTSVNLPMIKVTGPFLLKAFANHTPKRHLSFGLLF